ncbi:MAG: hypothetical protein AABX51_00465 [Nanoarchaeota archaeon]
MSNLARVVTSAVGLGLVSLSVVGCRQNNEATILPTPVVEAPSDPNCTPKYVSESGSTVGPVAEEFARKFQTFNGFVGGNYVDKSETGKNMPFGNAYADGNLSGDLFGQYMILIHTPTKQSLVFEFYGGVIDAVCKNGGGNIYASISPLKDADSERVLKYALKANPNDVVLGVGLVNYKTFKVTESGVPSHPVSVDDIVDAALTIPNEEYEKATRYREQEGRSYSTVSIEVEGLKFYGFSASELPSTLYRPFDKDPANYIVVATDFSVDLTSVVNRKALEADNQAITRNLERTENFFHE